MTHTSRFASGMQFGSGDKLAGHKLHRKEAVVGTTRPGVQVAKVTPAKMAVAVAALSNLLRSCPSDLAPVFVDKCYSDDAIAKAYFQVLRGATQLSFVG